MSVIRQRYNEKCNTWSDIYEHLPTLYKYALDCNHITECGVRFVTSSYAFAYGLLHKENAKLVQVDPSLSNEVRVFKEECDQENVPTIFYNQSDLDCPIESTDLLFIDTWHIYAQLKRELSRWHSSVNKYIIMHDTTVDEWSGESVRCGQNTEDQSRESGFPEEEIRKGLWPAIEEFLRDHPEWILKERFTNNHGLTVLARV